MSARLNKLLAINKFLVQSGVLKGDLGKVWTDLAHASGMNNPWAVHVEDTLYEYLFGNETKITRAGIEKILFSFRKHSPLGKGRRKRGDFSKKGKRRTKLMYRGFDFAKV